MIGDDIEVKIVGIRGRHVRLGIEAPGRVPVHRREVYIRVARDPQVHEIADSTQNST